MKNKSEIGIVFMGTPEFSVAILEKLIEEDYAIKAVVTAPDRPAGRGRKIQKSAVKKCALQHQLPVLQPTNLKDEDFVAELSSFQADLFIVVAFRMLPEVVWKIPSLGTFNLHASLLPQYRGAAPINWAIINGETKTGVTTFFIDEKIDTGAMLRQEEMEIGSDETAGELHDRMMVVGAKTVVDTVEMIRQGEANPQPQTSHHLLPAPKIFKQDCLIDLSKPIVEVHNFIRGLSPYPTAWMTLYNKERKISQTIKIFKTQIVNQTAGGKNQLLQEGKELWLQTQTGTLSLLEVQLQGKKRMSIEPFLAGFRISEWEIKID